MSDTNVPKLDDKGTVQGAACGLEALQGERGIPDSIFARCAAVRELNLPFNNIPSSQLPVLEKFTSLEVLVLDNNDLDTIETLPSLPRLHTLWLNNNRLISIDTVLNTLARQCPRLTYLSLLRNPCNPNELTMKTTLEYTRHRLYVKHKLPTLQYLDAAPFTEQEVKEAKERGQFMQTRTAAPKPLHEEPAKPAEGGAPAEGPEPDYFKQAVKTGPSDTFVTQQKHVYTGKTSEGNRFIRDDVL